MVSTTSAASARRPALEMAAPHAERALEGSRARDLSGWGRFPVERCREFRPRGEAELAELVARAPAGGVISRGMGRAYGDAALNAEGLVLDQTSLDRFLGFDDRSGLLDVEAGATLADVVEHLLPRGWFLPVTPGTKFVTVGGALAADVHGKNHHVDGAISSFVDSLDLLTASGAVLRCSRTENTEAFWATLGGMGLTGIILAARLRLLRVETAYVTCTEVRCENLDALLEQFEETDRAHRYSVAWLDCLASGRSLGRGVLMLGDGAPLDALPLALRHVPLTPPRRRTLTPPPLPSGALNRWTVSAFNALFYARHASGSHLADYDRYFYPLDAMRAWNRVYGRRGFVQYQALVPEGAPRAALVELLEAVVAARASSFLAVLKRSGPGTPGPLAFLSAGHTLALDIPNRGEETRALAARLDRIVVKHGGRVYLAKDALTEAAVFRDMYPMLERFRSVKARLDPDGLFVSSLARRLGIVAP